MANQVPLAIADLELQLASAIGPGDESFTLSSNLDDDGNAIPAGIYVFTVDNGTSQKEYLLGQVNGVNVTGVKSVSRQGVESTGAARRHRIGAPCIVTNFATIQRVADILRGTLTLDGSSPVAYDTAPTLSDNEQLATVGYVLAAATGDAEVAFNKQVIAGTAGETVALGDVVYFKEDDQEWYKAVATDAATISTVQLGIALGAGSDGAGITGGVQLSGVFNTTGLTAGDSYYVSSTAGEISNSFLSRPIGIALSATVLLFLPEDKVQRTTGVPIGTVMPYAGSTAPTNYLLAQGQAVSRATYAVLFSVLGTTYGAGDGSTTFNLPNLQGRVPVGLDSSQTEFDSLGETGGAKTHTLTTAQMPSHGHNLTTMSQSSADPHSAGNRPAGSASGASFSGTNSVAVQNTGSGEAHNNLQPYVTLNYIVRAL